MGVIQHIRRAGTFPIVSERRMTSVSSPFHEMQADILKAMGHPIRMRIMRFLGDGERPVAAIVEAVGARQSNVSRHLSLLRHSGVLKSRKSGLQVFYSLSSPELSQAVDSVLVCVREMARLHLAE